MTTSDTKQPPAADRYAASVQQVNAWVRWETLAVWFGRGLFLLALWMGQQMLSKVDDLAEAQAAQVEQLQAIAVETRALAHDIQTKTALRWTQVDQKLWATQLAQLNPKIIVPDPQHIEIDAPLPTTLRGGQR